MTITFFLAAGLCGVAAFGVSDAGKGPETAAIPLAYDGATATATLHTFLLPRGEEPLPAALVCPGGGYAGLAMDYEGTEVAQWLNSNGLSAFVLEYRVAPHRHPAPLHDAQQAIRLIRTHAVEWGLDPARLGILGFSAGGHLAATASTHYDTTPGLDAPSARPDFSILIYPVISFLPPFGHAGCGENLLGPGAAHALMESLSAHEQVTSDTPPAFLVHSTGDSVVSPLNSIAYYQALTEAGVPSELHIYEQGEHGYGMGKGDPALSTWPGLCIEWLRKRGILAP